MNDENRTTQALNDRLQEMRRLLGEMQPGSGKAGETRQESENRFRRLIKTSEAIAAIVGERDPYKKGHQCPGDGSCLRHRDGNGSFA